MCNVLPLGTRLEFSIVPISSSHSATLCGVLLHSCKGNVRITLANISMKIGSIMYGA